MDKEEIKNFVEIWSLAVISLTYCYLVSSKIPKGKFRFLSLLPVVFLFTILPLKLRTIFFGGPTTFFLVWLGNFKLLLFSFGNGPLASQPSISLAHFITTACLPIRIPNKENPSLPVPKKMPISPLNLAAKGLFLALLSPLYEHKDFFLHNYKILVSFFYCGYLYFSLELLLAVVGMLAAVLFGFELEPQFDEPYLATSLQDFWGRRWNLMVTNILRPTVYKPLQNKSTKASGRRWVSVLPVIITFIMSGLMHELIFFYLGRLKPTFEVTSFFVLHGICLAVEIEVKRRLKGRWQLHRIVSGPLAVGFVMVTCFWLFFPPLVRCDLDGRISRDMADFFDFLDLLVRDLGFTQVSSLMGSVHGVLDAIAHSFLYLFGA